MHPFDWGVTKPWGEMILLVTATLYCAALWLSAKQWLVASHASPRRYLPAFAGVVFLGIMLYESGTSIFWQMTSAHCQQSTHMLAIAVIASGSAVSFSVGSIARRKANKTPEHISEGRGRPSENAQR